MPFSLRHSEIRIQADKVWLDAYLSFAPDVRGLAICAVPHLAKLREARESHLCGVIESAGFATLLLSVLTPYEDSRDPDLRYDIALISQRLAAVTNWIDHQPGMGELPLALVASSTVAAGAIRLVQQNSTRFSALVSKAGRIDLAGGAPLRQLQLPTLVILPGTETELSSSTRLAFELLTGPRQLLEIPRASADFAEPGALDAAAQASRDWLLANMPHTVATPSPGAPAPESNNDGLC